jgi:DNA end-binding protein Ku
LVLHTLYYEDELRATHRPAAPKSTFTSKELDLAKNLIEHLSAPFRPKEFHDTYRENVQHMLEQKDKGQKIAAVKQPRKAPVVDLLEALKRSLKSAPPASSPARKPASATRHTRKSAGRRHAA